MGSDPHAKLRICVEEWRARLASLNGVLARSGVLFSWFWKARAKVLAYLVSRYGREIHEERPLSPAEKEALELPGRQRTPALLSPILRSFRPGKPPKSPSVIRALLEDIHRLNSCGNYPGNGMRENHC